MGEFELPTLGEIIRFTQGDEVVFEGEVVRVYGDAVSIDTDDGPRFVSEAMLRLPDVGLEVVGRGLEDDPPSGYL